jgi:hypothetical protein
MCLPAMRTFSECAPRSLLIYEAAREGPLGNYLQERLELLHRQVTEAEGYLTQLFAGIPFLLHRGPVELLLGDDATLHQ